MTVLLILLIVMGGVYLLGVGIEHAETKRVTQGRIYIGLGVMSSLFGIYAKDAQVPLYILVGYVGVILIFLGVREDNDENIIPEWAGRFIQIGIILLFLTATLWFVNVFSFEPHLARLLLTLGLWSGSELL